MGPKSEKLMLDEKDFPERCQTEVDNTFKHVKRKKQSNAKDTTRSRNVGRKRTNADRMRESAKFPEDDPGVRISHCVTEERCVS